MKRLESRILFWILILTGIPLFIVTWQSIHCSSQTVMEIQTSHLQSVLKWKSLEIESAMNELESDLKMLSIVSFEKDEQPEDTPECHQYGCTCSPLTHFRDNKDLYTALSAYSLDGSLLSNASETESDLPSSLPERFISKINKHSGVTLLKVVDQEKLSWLAGIKLINSTTRAHTGYIAARINLNSFLKKTLTPSLHSSFNVEVNVLSETGNTFSMNKADGNITLTDNESPLFSIVKESDSKTLSEFIKEGRTSLVLSRWIENPGVYLLVMVDKARTLGWMHTLLIRGVATGCALLILASFIALLISKKLSYPLRELAAVSKRIIEGDHRARVQEMDTIEAENVRMGFNTMLDRLQEQQRKLVQASSLAAIGELSSSIVHEMRNPLSSVKLNVNAIKEKLADDPVFRELAEIAVIQVDRLDSMLTELLKFGSPVHFKTEQVNITDLVESCIPLIQNLVDQKKLKVTVNIHCDRKQSVPGDREYLTRAFSNLLKNAAEACHSMGEITVDVKKEKTTVHIQVTDEGDGIADAVRDLLFKPFFTTKDHGTGLGLANVRKIAESHSGCVQAENAEGTGARFTLSLPV